MLSFRQLGSFIGGLLLLVVASPHGTAEEKIDFATQIRPILETRCYDCHDEESSKGGLRLDAKAAALRGGDTFGRPLIPGKPDQSPLLRLVANLESDFDRMPPKGKGLDEKEIHLIRTWISQGAHWPDDGIVIKDPRLSHWSFLPISRPDVPDSEYRNPIDAFIEARLSENNLTFSSPASDADLIRRLHLDLTGLLPDQAALTALQEDTGLGSWHRYIDRTLNSPQFGERWARHWLDVVRFAESAGFETNHERPNAFHYRDYVIRAFNDDKPYDQFVFEQIAGDTVGQDAATGFIVGGPYDRVKGKDPLLNKMQRQDELADMVNTTGTAFLGLTLGCAKCHNHKFDPVTQTDFYAFQSAFAGVVHGERDLEGIDFPERKAKAARLGRQIEELRAELAHLQPAPIHGRTLIIDDSDAKRTEVIVDTRGTGSNPTGKGRGQKEDPGGINHLPNISGGSYSWWSNQPDLDVFAYRPSHEHDEKFRVWLSWGSGYQTHTTDAQYVLDRDGDLGTRHDQSIIATIDQQRFADSTGEVPSQPLWSGFFDAGVHMFSPESALILRGGKYNTAITADTIVLQSPNVEGTNPRLRVPVTADSNVERFSPVKAKWVRFTIDATNNGSQPCIDELEIWANSTNVALKGKPSASSNFPSNPKHQLAHINDGKYGNSRSWISGEKGKGWVQIELEEITTINKITWARDRERKYTDRLPTAYRIEVATEPNQWQTLISSDSRAPQSSPETDPVAYNLAGLPHKQAQRAREVWKQIQPLEETRTKLLTTPKVYAGIFQQPSEPTRRLFRGDPLAPKEVVAPSAIEAFADRLPFPDLAADAPEQERRVALAKWMIDRRNPLTARVIVNRLWHYHFGRGLVGTPSDFGRMGFKPTHPDLLDWLASELMDHNWSLKHIHRLILTSETYRQSSQPRMDALAIDAQSNLLWRFPPRRLEAEAIRDNVLLVSGSLDREMYGPGFLLFQPNANYSRNWIPKDEFGPGDMRRMVYALKLRMEQDAIFGAFDCPDAGQIAPSRSRSTTPIQALNLYNSGFMLEQATRFADRIARETGPDPTDQITSAYQLTLGRAPDSAEIDQALQLVESHGLVSLCRALFNANEFLFLR